MNILERNLSASCETPHFCHLKDENDEPHYLPDADGNPDLSKPIGLMMYGPHAPQVKKVNNMRAAQSVLAGKKMNGKTPSIDDILGVLSSAQSGTVEDLVQKVADWVNFCDADGPRKFDRDELLRFFRNNPNYARQAAEFADEEANFTKPA